jgi:hypothetical protein
VRAGDWRLLKLLSANVPRALAEHPDEAAVLAECRAALAMMQPASAGDFARAYERLALHYPEGTLSQGEQKIVFADWRRLLGATPADVLEEAIDALLLTPARFFPTPGQLATFVERAIGMRRSLAGRAKATIEMIEARR